MYGGVLGLIVSSRLVILKLLCWWEYSVGRFLKRSYSVFFFGVRVL